MDSYWFDIPKGELTVLVNALDDSNDGERRMVRTSLIAKGHEAVPNLINGLKSTNAVIRYESARLLGEIHDPASVDALIEALYDKNTFVRQATAQSLIDLRRPAVKPLVAQLANPENVGSIRKEARTILDSLFEIGVVNGVAIEVMEALDRNASDEDVASKAKKSVE
ncbi:MAG: HEAT repeat domain-containing protein [Chloroflexi bacterium]|nr:HEAT repeat domain-containing protein [Chloroflexota bacterium]